MARITDHFTLKIANEQGGDVQRSVAAVRHFSSSRQTDRSRNAALAAGIPMDDTDSIVDFVIAHQLGARDAFRFAQLIFSDPEVKGREIEALRLLERGCDHAEVRAALRAARASGEPQDPGSSVVQFRRPTAINETEPACPSTIHLHSQPKDQT